MPARGDTGALDRSPKSFHWRIRLISAATKPVPITVTLADFSITMSQATVGVNAPLVFTITNNGAVQHEMVLEGRGVHDEPFTLNDKTSEAEDIEPGETRTFEWTLTEAGEYQLACYKPGHFEQGMVAYFTVEP